MIQNDFCCAPESINGNFNGVTHHAPHVVSGPNSPKRIGTAVGLRDSRHFTCELAESAYTGPSQASTAQRNQEDQKDRARDRDSERDDGQNQIAARSC